MTVQTPTHVEIEFHPDACDEGRLAADLWATGTVSMIATAPMLEDQELRSMTVYTTRPYMVGQVAAQHGCYVGEQ